MSLSTLNYTKDWTSAEDFPTVQTDENQVRADQQFLFNEIKDYLNDTLIPGIESAIAVACQDLVVGQLTDGSVTKNKLSAALIEVLSRAELGGDLDARINNVSSEKVSKTGDTMTGSLTIERAAYPQIVLKNTTYGSVGNFQNNNHITELGAKSSNVSGADYRSMRIYDNLSVSDLKEAFKLVDRTDGAVRSYDILHTGNLSDLGIARIAIGSYKGTGTHGSDKPNRLTLPFEPKFLYVSTAAGFALSTRSQTNHVLYDTLFWQEGINQTEVFRDCVYISRSGNTISWYSADPYSQLNNSEKEYYYIAIG